MKKLFLLNFLLCSLFFNIVLSQEARKEANSKRKDRTQRARREAAILKKYRENPERALYPDSRKIHCEAFKGEWKRECLTKKRNGCAKFGSYYCSNRYEYQQKPIKLSSFKVDEAQWCVAHGGIWKKFTGEKHFVCAYHGTKKVGQVRYPINYKRLQSLKFRDKKELSTCCFCIFDRDQITKDICDYWFSKNKCNFKQRLNKSHSKELIEQDIICHESKIYGGFHGESSDYPLPFEIAKSFATNYSSSSVCYDGDSCLVFNDYYEAKNCAAKLQGDDCVYKISGNQNRGVVNGGFFCPGKTIEGTSSKLSFEISKVVVKLQFDDCQKEGIQCAYKNYKPFFEEELGVPSSNPNIMKCVDESGVVVTQECCKSRKWNRPESTCN